MEITPVKLSNEETIGGLSESFTNLLNLQMQEENKENRKKSSYERLTIEGSPITFFPKKMDLNATPAIFRSLNSQIIDSVKDRSTNDGLKVNLIPAANLKQKVLVITAGKDEHETGQHQENSLRTALLSDPIKGCLHRGPLSNHVKWVRDDMIRPASLADLLRVHEFTYLNHLQKKCEESSNSHNEVSLSFQPEKRDFPSFYAPKGFLDTDTPLSPQSLNASTMFCGAAILAVDAVMQGIIRYNVWAIVSLSIFLTFLFIVLRNVRANILYDLRMRISSLSSYLSTI
jgi:acetoin utilization deacetylase AcuC-like enzyme